MMRIILLLFIVSGSLLNGQVTMLNNIPAGISPGAELTVEIKINKGAISNFAKYQMDVPQGVIIKEIDSKGGTFAFENNRVKIIWNTIPAGPELTLNLKLLAGNTTGASVINQKFYYMEGDARKEVEADAINVNFGGETVKKNVTSGEKVQSNMQAAQLKKDSKDAYDTGIKEQEAAEKKLAAADEALKKAEALNDDDAKKTAIEKANASKQKAEKDKVVASKILMLAKSLDDNANEIERLNAASGGSTAASAPAENTVVSDNGIVYRIQIGAFSQNPEKALSKHIGTIDIVNEAGMYKVLMGKFAKREDAARKREELIKRSFDCFIVTYKDGVRVK